jgi:tol-pal system protein YbgF
MMQRLLLPAFALFLVAASPAQAQLFGPSDEEVAAEKAHEDGQDNQIRANATLLQQQQAQNAQLQTQLRSLTDRVQSLTESLARATGANEELAHQISQMNARMEQQSRDFAYRICTISAQQLGADPQGLNCAAAGTQSATARPAPPPLLTPGASLPPIVPNSNPGGVAALGRGPGTLGTLSASGPPAQLAPAPAPSAVSSASSGGTDSRQFDAAMNLLARAQYAEASAAFRAYADSHPDDPDLTPQALYWVGNIAYIQQDYPTAARVFAEQIKRFPKHPRGADSMLKMGQSLVAVGQTRNGCTAFAAIRKQYPDASPSTVTAATNARRAASCS